MTNLCKLVNGVKSSKGKTLWHKHQDWQQFHLAITVNGKSTKPIALRKTSSSFFKV